MLKAPFNKKFNKGFLNSFVFAKEKQLLGYVEEIGADVISGWAFHRKSDCVELRLRLGDELLDLQPQWIERHDVAEAHGMRAIKSGFIFFPDRAISGRLAAALDNDLQIAVLANDLTLPAHKRIKRSRAESQWAANHIDHDGQHMFDEGDMPDLSMRHVVLETSSPKPEPKEEENGGISWKPLDISVNSQLLRSRLESWGGFSILGWALVSGKAAKSFTAIVAGTAHPLQAVRREGPESEDEPGDKPCQSGFEINLPGYLWELADENPELSLILLADGEQLTPHPIMLTRKVAGKWIDEIAAMQEGDDQLQRMLLACEHMRYGALEQFISSDAAERMFAFAKRMHLDEYLPERRSGTSASIASGAAEDVNSLLLWEVMRELNATMTHSKGSVFELIRDNGSWRNLPAQAKEWYLNLAVQLTCESNEFLRLRELTDFGLFQKFEWSEEASQLTLALPALVAEQHMARAVDLMWRLTKKANSGWIYTENVRFSVEHIQRLEGTGEIDFAIAEKFRSAYLWLLESFKGEWFSRLHDANFIDATIRILSDSHRYTDSHKRDVVSAAIRHYGLCPTFWVRMKARALHVRDDEIDRATCAWSSISATLENYAQASIQELIGLLENLAYFQGKGNPESAIFIREIVVNRLEEINKHVDRTGHPLLKALIKIDPSEALRIAAYPVSGTNKVQPYYPETSTRLGSLVRQMTEGAKSPVYELQQVAALGLRQAQIAAEGESHSELRLVLTNLENTAVALSNWQSGFLVADLLAAAYSLAAKAGLDEKRFLMRLSHIIKKVTHETNADYYIPASVYAALSRLVSLPQNLILQSFLNEAKSVIESKFGTRHGNLFETKNAANQIATASGWPTDTVVVIESSRERLATYAGAIRKTWMQDLSVRGIPCIIAIEGDQDHLEKFRYADVLTLAVDRHDSSSTRMLRLLSWIYENTEAQFIVKVADDCYLNVERFFSTLTYRKHLYSGRVVRRGPGGFERIAHQRSATGLHARHSLDKSPERSVYADGAGAISFSRLALQKLHEIQNTTQGSRIIASSYHGDKLVGDLLALSNIYPSNEDCEHVHRHRTHETAIPVAFEENSFYSCKTVPAKVMHLDCAEDFSLVRERSIQDDIWPKKIWASCWIPSIKPNGNQLELLSPIDRLGQLLKNELVVVAVVRNEMIMAPHFLDHYRKLGVECFIFVDNCSNDGSREYLLSQKDTIVYSVETAYKHSHYGVTWQQAVLASHCLGKWVVLADADEFLVFQDCEERNLKHFIREIEAGGMDAAFVHMIDMYPFGDLDDASFEKGAPFDVAPYFDKNAQIELKFGGGHFSNSRNLVNGLRHRLAPSRINSYVSQKYALFKYKPWIRLTEGIHYSANLRVASVPAYFAHFKYHAGFKNKVQTEIKRNQHFNGAEEYRRYAGMLAEGSGRFGRADLSVRYASSKSFVELFK